MQLDKKEYKISITYFVVLIILLILFNIGDIVSTFQVLGMGAIEGNPFARWLFGLTGLAGAIVGKIVMLSVVIPCLLYARKKNEIMTLIILAFILGMVVTTVYCNFLVYLNLNVFPPL